MHTPTRTPHHVAIIMDGNGRWAAERGRPRTFGHVRGAERVKMIVQHAVEIELPVLTLWGFSTENWRRPKNEVNALMKLFQRFAVREAEQLDAANIRVSFIGRRSDLPAKLQEVMIQIETNTASNTGLLLRLAINYSGLQTYADAASALAARGESITDASLAAEIWHDTPPYDLVIRTSGEQRTSDFPVGHAELYFTIKHWPDFTPEEFNEALMMYATRDRRYGAVTAVK